MTTQEKHKCDRPLCTIINLIRCRFLFHVQLLSIRQCPCPRSFPIPQSCLFQRFSPHLPRMACFLFYYLFSVYSRLSCSKHKDHKIYAPSRMNGYLYSANFEHVQTLQQHLHYESYIFVAQRAVAVLVESFTSHGHQNAVHLFISAWTVL